MIFRQLFDIQSCTYTYIVGSDETGSALIIDPVRDKTDVYLKLLNELGLSLSYALDTHIHADHVTGLGTLREKTGCETMMGAFSVSECVSAKLTDGDRLYLDNTLSVETLYTPGHTIESCCFLLADKAPVAIFTGDLLLIRSTGRTDFQSGNAKASYQSIVERIFTLDDDVVIYPGHDYAGFTCSTVLEEKRFNPRLANKDCGQYCAIMNALSLPDPKMMDVAIPANIRCGLT